MHTHGTGPKFAPAHSVALRAILVEKYAPHHDQQSVLRLARRSQGGVDNWGTSPPKTTVARQTSPPVREPPRPPGRSLSRGELRALFSSCALDSTPAGVRDAAILGVLYGAGLRRVELASLALSDYHPDTQGISVRGGTAGPRICFPPNRLHLGPDQLDCHPWPRTWPNVLSQFRRTR